MFQIEITPREKNRLIATCRAATIYFLQFEIPAHLVCSIIDGEQTVTENNQSPRWSGCHLRFFFLIPHRVECVF